MDVLTLVLWALRIAFLVLIYVVLLMVARALWRDLRATVREEVTALGRLVVVVSPLGQPERGSSIPLDTVTSFGRDVNSTVVLDDDAAADDQAVLSFRGRLWTLEDRAANGETRVNGRPFEGTISVGYGDEIGLGGVRMRLERAAEAGDR